MNYFRYKLILFIILCFVHFQINSQTNLSIGSGENITISNGGILTINNVFFEPTSTISLSNINITEANSTANTANIDNINKVLISTGNIINFTGQITIGYTLAQLNGISESSLKISFFDLIWNPSTSSIVNSGLKTVTSSFTNSSFSELTLQGIAGTSLPISSPISASSGGGGPVSVILDSDGDGILNSDDAFPNDPNEWLDSDNDGIGDNQDLDDDNDGISDTYEGICFTDPKNPYDFPGDYDRDTIPNCIDKDDDQDGYLDQDEIECGSDPLDEADFPLDTDQDLLANCIDPDDDNDSYLDEIDAFPLDSLEWLDTDGDGIGNNVDKDDDDDCYSDTIEISESSDPLDSNSIPFDMDYDCIPDSIDPDKNNDGYRDDQLIIPEFISPNGDGINDVLIIINIEFFPNNELNIYTRSGEKIFMIRDYKNDWEGTKSSGLAPEGSYFYTIDKESDGNIDNQGWIYLSR